MNKRHTKGDYIKTFGESFAGDDCELDLTKRGRATVSLGDDPGAWVRAWVWVPDYEVEKMKERQQRCHTTK